MLSIHPHREAVIRNRIANEERRLIEAGKVRMSPDELQTAQKERSSFNRMAWYLKSQKKAVLTEKRVTAFWGCKTSWPRIERHAIYAVVSESNEMKRAA